VTEGDAEMIEEKMEKEGEARLHLSCSPGVRYYYRYYWCGCN